MGRRGQGERESSSVSSDAMPALTGRRRVGAVMRRSEYSGKQGGTAEIAFLSLLPCMGEQGFFIFERTCSYETAGKTMAALSQFSPSKPSHFIFKKGNYSAVTFSVVKSSRKCRKIQEIATPVCALVRNDPDD